MSLPLKSMLQLVGAIELESKSYIEIEKLCGKPDYANAEEWIYTIRRSFSGLFSKKLHLYFSNGKVVDYCTCYYIMGLCFM